MHNKLDSLQRAIVEIPNILMRNFRRVVLLALVASIPMVGLTESKNLYAGTDSSKQVNSPIPTPDPNYADNVLWLQLKKPDGSDPHINVGDIVDVDVAVTTNFTVAQSVKVTLDLSYLEVGDSNDITNTNFTECQYGSSQDVHFAVCNFELPAGSSFQLILPHFMLRTRIKSGAYPVRATLYASPTEVNKPNNSYTSHFYVDEFGNRVFLPEILQQ